MSNLLEQASLVLIPSGYKEDVVYSEIPLDGSGDLQFTRSSDGTRINSQGLVEVCPWNLVQNSEQYNAGTWSSAFLSISANATTAPNGTTTADLIYPSSSQAYCYVSTTSFSVVGGQIYTQSVYLKSSGFRWGIVDNMAGSPGAWFDLLNGVVGNVASGCTASIESVGNGWYRCSVSSVAPSSTNYADFRMSDSNGSDAVTANGTDGLLAWGFQLNIGSTAKPYFPTTDRLNVPRLTYQNGGGGCPSLLLEKQSTNVITYSEDFSNAAWTKNVSVTANAIISPDGTQNADKILESASNVQQWAYQSPSMTGAQTATIYAKKGERNYIAMATAGLDPSYFNLDTGVVVSTASGATASITSVGNGWYRCSVSSASIVGGTFFIIWISDNGTRRSYAGDTSKGVYIWGAQNEASSYPTSYIPTTSSSATRVIDDCRKTGISSLIGQSEGTLFIDLNLTAWDSNSFYFGLYGGGNEIYFRCTATGAIGFVHYFGSTQAFLSQSGLSLGRHKLAACYKNNDWAFYVDGILAGTDTSGTFSGTISEMVFGYTSISAYPPFHSVNQAILFPTRLTNAELQALTTL